MYLIRHILIKVQYIIIEQNHIKCCKQTLNAPWYTEITACRAELGQYSDETFTTLVHYKNEAIKISNVLRTFVSALNNRKKLSQDWLKAQNDISDNSRQKDTKKEIKKDH